MGPPDESAGRLFTLVLPDGAYVVLFEDADLQAYRTDRFEGWLRQPADVGPTLFTNSSPTYANLTVIDGGGDDGGSSTGLIIGIVVGAVVVIGGVALLMRGRSKKSADERE